MNNQRKMSSKLFTMLMFLTSTLLICCIIMLILESYTIDFKENNNDNRVSYIYKNVKMHRAYRSEIIIEGEEIVPHSEELLEFSGFYYYKEITQTRNKSSILSLDSFIPGDKLEFDLVLTNLLKADLTYVVRFINELDELDNLFDYFEIESDYQIKHDDEYIWNLWDYNRLNKTKTIHYSISIPITANAYDGPFKLKIEVLTRAI